MARLLRMEEIKKMIAWMLGFGMPVSEDCAGYNAEDYEIMRDFY